MQENQQLQIQICEHLSNLINHLDQKINYINSSITILDQKMNQIITKMEGSNLEYEFDTNTKRKLSQARKEKEFNRILEREKKLWENEYAEQDRLIDLERQKWEKEYHEMKLHKDEDHSFSYLS